MKRLRRRKERVLRADLRCHVAAATHSAPLAFSRPNGREVATDALQLIAEAASHLGTASGVATTEKPASADPEAIARRGVEGAGGRLPHLDTIQRLFGSHDVSNVKAHIGGAAADASREIGAQAYAHGNDVAFAEQPGLHLVAHEAAHVVQQRAGIAFKNGEVGDEFEKHADAVADTVVAGQSAEPLLSAMAGRGTTAAPSRPVIQRKPVGDASQAEAFAPSREFARYVQVHAVDLGQAVARQLANTIWPDPTEDTPFTRAGERRFSQRLSALVRDQLDQPEHLVTMLYPGNALERFQQYVIAPGQLHNQAYRGFGEPLAQLVELAAKESLTKRVGPRYAQLLSQMVRRPTADDIIAGHPIDPIVAVAVCEEGILEANVAAVKDIGPVKINHVDVHWLGRQNGELWNFVQATPATATPEEVAAALWGDPKKTTMAFAVEKYGDVFRVAPAYARQVLTGRYPGEPVGTSDVDASRAKQMVVLAKSAARHGEAATAEFTGEQQTKAVSAEQLADVENHVGTLLDQIAVQLARVAMDKLVQPAVAARQARAKTLASADAATRSHWLPVLSFQHTQLLTINAQLPAAVQAYQKVFAVLSFGDATRRRAHDDAEALVRDLAAAAGTSHLRDESTAIMRRIEQRQQAGAQNQLDATAAELHDATSSNVDSGGRTMQGNADAEHDIEQQRQIAQNKGKTSQYDRRKALIVAGEHALLARMDSAERSLLQLQEAADAAGFANGDALRQLLHNAKIKSFPEIITDVRDHLTQVHRTWDGAIADPKNRPEVLEEGAPAEWDDWQAREVALPLARSEFAKIAGDQALGDFIREAVKKIQVQRIVTALTTLAEALLLTVAAGAGAASIARAAASLVAEEGTLAFAGVEIAVSAPINSLVQMAVSGDGNTSFGWTMLENGLMDMFTRGLLRPMKNAEKAARDEVREIAALPHLTGAERVAASSASFMGLQPVAELVAGMASQWAARHIVELARSKKGGGGAHDEGVSDGPAVAAQVPGTTYDAGGTFVITTARGSMAVSIRRTTGAASVRSNGRSLVVEIPRGLKGAALERVVVEQLAGARALVESGRAPIDSEKGIAGGRRTFEDFAGGPVSADARARAHDETESDDAMSLPEHAKRIATGTARSEGEMLAAIAQGDTPRYLARVDGEESFLKYGTFGRFNREFIYATEPADLRGVSPGKALEKVGWTKEWMGKFVNQEIAICVFDTQAAIKTPAGERKTSVGKMAWDHLINRALNDANFVDLAIATAGVADKAELAKILGILERTPVRAEPSTGDPSLAAKAKAVAKLLDKTYSANDLFTGIGATMNVSGDLGVREVMLENNGTEFRLTPENHTLIRIGKLTQEEFDALP